MGFYSFVVTSVDASFFVDDTYSYEITQSGVSLKKGYVRLIVGEEEISLFDYSLDFLLA